MLAVPGQESLRLEGLPERDEDRTLGDECSGGKTQGDNRKKDERARHGSNGTDRATSNRDGRSAWLQRVVGGRTLGIS